MRLMWLAERPHDLKLTVPRTTMSARRVGRHDGQGEIGDDGIVGSWSGRGLGNHRPNQEPTSSVLREAHARPSRVLKHSLSARSISLGEGIGR